MAGGASAIIYTVAFFWVDERIGAWSKGTNTGTNHDEMQKFDRLFARMDAMFSQARN